MNCHFCSNTPSGNAANKEDVFVNTNYHNEPLCISSDTLDFLTLLCKNFILVCLQKSLFGVFALHKACLLYTSDAADE